MDDLKLNKELKSFWDTQAKDIAPMEIKPEQFSCEDNFDRYMKDIGDNYSTILDIGTGFGISLLTMSALGTKCTKLVGIDTSENSINFATQTAKLSNLKNIEFHVGGEDYLDNIQSESFDAIVCSNVLDVITPSVSDKIIKSIMRILKKDGLLFVKINFFLTDELIEKTHAEYIGDDCYLIDGILRSRNISTDEWVKKFSSLTLIKEDEYARIKNGPKDRVLLFKKN